jgi:hypothetical protein
LAISIARSASSRVPWRNSSLFLTSATFFSMSSAVQPRECATNGNCGR